MKDLRLAFNGQPQKKVDKLELFSGSQLFWPPVKAARRPQNGPGIPRNRFDDRQNGFNGAFVPRTISYTAVSSVSFLFSPLLSLLRGLVIVLSRATERQRQNPFGPVARAKHVNPRDSRLLNNRDNEGKGARREKQCELRRERMNVRSF